MQKAKRYLFIFDFDQTIMNYNTDSYILKCLKNPLPQEIVDMAPKGWHKYMKEVLRHINSQNVSVEEMQNCLRSMKLTNGFDKILEFISNRRQQIDSVIVSDSNQFFIETILESLQIQPLFKNVLTNPVKIANGAVTMTAFHEHSCPTPTCPENICKRVALLDTFDWEKDVRNVYDGICYFGDGQNDYCPLQLLGKDDIVFARRGFTLDALVNTKPHQCQTFIWMDGEEILNSPYFKSIGN